jgi:outer membrane protein assembly factor BamB
MAELWHAEAVPTNVDVMLTPRLWVTDRAAVAVTSSGVQGFDPATGEPSWELPSPEGADVPCGASPEVNARGIGAVLYRPVTAPAADVCSMLAVVDTASGELLWSEDLTTPDPEYAHPAASGAPVTVGEETVSIELIEDGLHRFAIDDGSELPLPEVPAHQACDAFWTDWRHSATHLVAVTSCEEMAATGEESQLSVYDAASGEELWTVADAVGADEDLAAVLADAPLTITTADRLLSFGEGGEALADVPLDRAEGYVSTDPGEYAIQDSVLVTTIDDSGQEYLGIDLTTGEDAWQESREGPAEAFLGGSDQVLVLYSDVVEETNAISDHMARLNGQDGALSVEGVLPEGSGFVLDMAAGDDALYLLAEPADGEDGTARIEAYERP